MPFIYANYQLYSTLIIVLQLVTVIHAVRNGRTNPWLYIILFLPFVGSLAYIIVEILPDWRLINIERIVYRLKSLWTSPQAKIARLEKELAFIDTIKTREALAQAYLQAGDTAKAIEYYKTCLNGLEANDIPIRDSLVELYLKTGQFNEAKTELFGIKNQRKGTLTSEELFSLAKAQESLGEFKEALNSYKQAVHDFHSLEINYRFMKLLQSQGSLAEIAGQQELARRKYQQMLPKLRGPEKKWLKKIEEEFS